MATLVHEGGWRVEFAEDGEPLFYRPDGTPLAKLPPIACAPVDPLAAFEQAHVDRAIDAETGLTRWDGTRPDYDLCVQVACGLTEEELAMPAAAWLVEHGLHA